MQACFTRQTRYTAGATWPFTVTPRRSFDGMCNLHTLCTPCGLSCMTYVMSSCWNTCCVSNSTCCLKLLAKKSRRLLALGLCLLLCLWKFDVRRTYTKTKLAETECCYMCAMCIKCTWFWSTWKSAVFLLVHLMPVSQFPFANSKTNNFRKQSMLCTHQSKLLSCLSHCCYWQIHHLQHHISKWSWHVDAGCCSCTCELIQAP